MTGMWECQEAAKAATGLEEAQGRLAQHGAAVEEARKLQADRQRSSGVPGPALRGPGRDPCCRVWRPPGHNPC